MTADRAITIGSTWQDAYGDEWQVVSVASDASRSVTLTRQDGTRSEVVSLTDTALWAGYERVEYE